MSKFCHYRTDFCHYRKLPIAGDCFFLLFLPKKKRKMSKILLIYDEIGYWGTTAKDVAQFLIDNEGESIDVHINSPGGDVFDAYAIYNTLKNTPSVTIYVDGIAAPRPSSPFAASH